MVVAHYHSKLLASNAVGEQHQENQVWFPVLE